MSWIMTLLQDIPISAILREKLGLIEVKFRDAEASKAVSDRRADQAEARVAELEIDKANLEKQIEDFAHIKFFSEEERLQKLREVFEKIEARALPNPPKG